MRCAICGERLVEDGPLGFVHLSSASRFGEDGHTVVPITDSD